MRTSGKLIIAGFLALTGVTANAHTDQTYNYTVTAHNHYGEAVHFSCNDVTPQEIHDGKTIKLRFRAGADVDLDCVASHDDKDVWSETVHVDSSHRRAEVEITDQGQQNNIQSRHDDNQNSRDDNQNRFNGNQSRFNNSQNRRDDNQSRFNDNQSRRDDSHSEHDEGRVRQAPSTPQSILNQLFPN